MKYSSERSDFLIFYAYLCHVVDDFAGRNVTDKVQVGGVIVRNGGTLKLKHQRNTKLDKGFKVETGGELHPIISHVMSMQVDGRNIFPLDGEANKKLERERELYLFSKEVSRYIDFSFIEKEYRSKEYTVMLRLDETLKAHLYVLLPMELTTEDRMVLTFVSMAVNQQPPQTFSGYWCSRGLYPAIFLKMCVSERTGCVFRDYNEETTLESGIFEIPLIDGEYLNNW